MKLIMILMLTLSTSYAGNAGVKNEDGSFKLTQKSINFLGVKFTSISGHGPWEIPLNAIVSVKFTQGIYRRYEGDIAFVVVKVLKSNGANVIVSSPDLEAGDEVAYAGVNYLRLAEADLNSDSVDSCSH